jgi:hypothetical protein
MNKKYSVSIIAAFFVLLQSCNNSNKSQTPREKEEVLIKEEKKFDKFSKLGRTGKFRIF